MADHGYFEELICAELDGELSADEAAELHAHLAGCERCRAFREAMSAVEGAPARHLPAPPAELTANVMAAVRAEAKQKKKGKILAFPGRSLAIAAAAALVLWAGFRATDIFRPKGGMTAAAPMAAVAESAAGVYDEGAEEEVVQAQEYVAEDAATDAVEAPAEAAPEAPAEEPVQSSKGTLSGNAVPNHGARANGQPPADVMCQISDKSGPLRQLPVSQLPEGLLVPGKTCKAPEREPDYIILVYVTGGDPEEYRFWEQDGAMIVETNAGEVGYSVSQEAFMQLLNN